MVAPAQPAQPPPWLADTSLRFLIVAALLFACLRIAEPFVVVLVWAVLLAVMLRPLHLRVQRLGIRNGWAAALLGLVGVLLLVAPAVAIVDSIALSAVHVVKAHAGEDLRLPDLPWLRRVPVAGELLAKGWTDVQNDTPTAISHNARTVEAVALWLGARAAGLASGFLHFVAAIGIAAVLLAYGDGLSVTATALVRRIAGDAARGDTLIALGVATIKSVVVGVIGMAVVQAVLLGGSLFVLGLPFAGVIAMVLLVFGIVQIPSQLISLPVLAWVWSTAGMRAALLFAGWIVVVLVVDAALKPIMLGRGLPVPVPIILVGVIGGALAAGLVGLFVGPVLLSVGYMLLVDWLAEPPPGAVA